MNPYGDISFDMLTFHADFNSLMEDGSMMVSRRYASSPRTPQQDEWVELGDYEGNRCRAKVVEATDKAVRVQVELSSWRPAVRVERLDTAEVENFSAEPSPPEKLKLEFAVA